MLRLRLQVITATVYKKGSCGHCGMSLLSAAHKPLSNILANNQLDALFHVFIYLFYLSTCFEHQVLIIRRSKCINTSSGMISLCK